MRKPTLHVKIPDDGHLVDCSRRSQQTYDDHGADANFLPGGTTVCEEREWQQRACEVRKYLHCRSDVDGGLRCRRVHKRDIFLHELYRGIDQYVNVRLVEGWRKLNMEQNTHVGWTSA